MSRRQDKLLRKDMKKREACRDKGLELDLDNQEVDHQWQKNSKNLQEKEHWYIFPKLTRWVQLTSHPHQDMEINLKFLTEESFLP